MKKKPKPKPKPRPCVYPEGGCRAAALSLILLGGCSVLQPTQTYLTEPVGPQSRPRVEAIAEAAKPFMDEKTSGLVGLALPLLGILLAGGTKPKPAVNVEPKDFA